MFVAERFLSDIVRDYGKHSVSSDGGTWYPQACRFLGFEHHIHSPMKKSLIESLSISKIELKVSMTISRVE
jgi:putative transposase